MTEKDLPSLARKLDTIFQQALDRMDAQTRDAIFIDNTLRRLLDEAASDEAIINWDPERAISPKLAFRALALRLIKEGGKGNTRQTDINPLDYEDLLSWPDAPRRRQGSPTEDFLACIDHARTKRLVDFWAQFHARISPSTDPEQALITATSDLLSAFAVVLPTEFVVPVAPASNGYRVLPFQMSRKAGELEWVVSAEAMEMVSRCNHAVSTLCHLGGEPTFSNLLLEMNIAFHNKMKANFRQYAHNETYLAGGVLSMRLHRDTIGFAMSPWVYDRVFQSLSKVRGLHFISTPRFY